MVAWFMENHPVAWALGWSCIAIGAAVVALEYDRIRGRR